jgi:hypothetical protein
MRHDSTISLCFIQQSQSADNQFFCLRILRTVRCFKIMQSRYVFNAKIRYCKVKVIFTFIAAPKDYSLNHKNKPLKSFLHFLYTFSLEIIFFISCSPLPKTENVFSFLISREEFPILSSAAFHSGDL